ncbi:MAG: YitT family protein [Coprobacillus cateniformis]
MHSLKRVIRDSLLVVLGNAVVAFGVAVFAVPSDLIVGGATGLSLIIEQFVSVNYATIVFGINMVMLIIGFLVLGKKFAAGTILSSFIFPFFLGLFEAIPQFQHITNDILLSAIYAGIFTGVGLGIVFRLGYSTGGMDVPPIILNKKKGVSVALAINVLDIMILVGQVFFSSFEGILYGIITVFVSTFVLDQVIVMGEKNLQVLVISAEHEKIAEAIFNEIDRGCTFVNVTTGYFHHQQKAVLCVANNREYAKINDLVMEIDPAAFIIGSEIHSVKGRGFTLPNIDLEKERSCIK